MAPATDLLPPGPRVPALAQTAGMTLDQVRMLRRLRRRHGDVFRVRLLALGDVVVVGDPDLVKQVFKAPADVLHAGDHSPLAPILGRHSLLATDERYHLRQRKLLLPPFHGDRMRAYEAIIEEEARAELATWPADGELEVLEPMMRITLNAILRAVFGARGEELEELRRLMPPFVELGSRLALLPWLHKDLGPRSPWGRFLALRREFDAHVDTLIAAGRRDPALEERTDVLALLLQARHEDGTPMHRDEIADQLLTLLSAGHETTAATLAWAVERLQRHPGVLARLEAEAGDGGRELRDATIREVQRIRPVIAHAGRYTMAPYRLGPYAIPAGWTILCSAVLTHDDPRFFERPAVFDPERFLGSTPDTYRWIPFGGGVRRCIGAAFAHMEMDVVLRTLLQEVELRPRSAPAERMHFRGVAFVPGAGGRARVRRRDGASAAPSREAALAAAA